MAKPFKLIEQLQQSNWKETHTRDNRSKSIQYQEYELTVQNKEIMVLIPIKECDVFEQEIESKQSIDLNELRVMLRRYRGIRG